jgi:hypothetical protein
MNENCPNIPRIAKENELRVKILLDIVIEMFIIKKKNDMKRILVPVNKYLFDNVNIKNVLRRRIIEIM